MAGFPCQAAIGKFPAYLVYEIMMRLFRGVISVFEYGDNWPEGLPERSVGGPVGLLSLRAL